MISNADMKNSISKYKTLAGIFLIIFFLYVSLPANAAISKVIIGYWSYPQDMGEKNISLSYPIPGSVDAHGNSVSNADMQEKLNYLNIIDYAFLTVNKDGIVHFKNSYIDLSSKDDIFCQLPNHVCLNDNGQYQPKLGNFDAFVRLNNRFGSLKKLISIGGSGSDKSFENAITHSSEFIDSVALIMTHYHLDGVDLDFEPDSFSVAQADSYGKLIMALREKLGASALITIAIAPDQNIKRQQWQLIAKNASYIADMCYEFHAPSYPPHYTGYSSNLYPDPNEPMMNEYYHISCDQSIKNLAFLGVPPEKIVLGFPSYAKTYNDVLNKNHGLFQPCNPKMQGWFPYRAALLKSGFHEYSTYYNSHISGVWAYNKITHQFLAYDNTALIREKANYVEKNNLGGLMTWEINDDAPATSKQSLLRAAYVAFNRPVLRLFGKT